MNHQQYSQYGQGGQYQYQPPNGAPLYYYQPQPQPAPAPAHPMVVIPPRQIQYQQYQSFDGTNETPYGQHPAHYPGTYAPQHSPASRQPQQYVPPQEQYRPPYHSQQVQSHQEQYQGQYHGQSQTQRQREQPNPQIHRNPPKHEHQYQPYPVKPRRSPQVPEQKSNASPKIKEEQKDPIPKPQSGVSEPPKAHDETPFDYQLLLLSMADEYIHAAHHLASKVAHMQDRQNNEDYYRLMATGLGCMDSVLKHFKLHPRAESKLRLRYATLLHEETDNHQEIEKVLSKGIQLSEKHRFLGLKYSMQHLLARTLFETKQKSALKFLDKVIPDVEAYHHTAWIYAFRFLRVTFSLQTLLYSEALAAIQNLRVICELAQGQDRAIFVTAATMQAMVHLRTSGPDSVEQAQQAIAAARSEQLDPSVQQLPQITSLLSFVDLVSVLQLHNEPDQIIAKMKGMNHIMDESRPDFKWNANGSVSIPLGQVSDGQTTQDTGGIFQRLSDGRDALMFCSLPQDELYSIAFLLSSLASFHRNSSDGKTNKFAHEGLKGLKDVLPHDRIRSTSLSAASDLNRLRAHLDLSLRIYRIFGFCDVSNWTKAKEELDGLRRMLKEFPYQIPPHAQSLMLYLQGSIHQSSGNLDLALKVFRSSALALSPPSNRISAPHQQLTILAALNSVLILRNPSLNSYPEASEVLGRLQPLCSDHSCKSIRAAFTLVQALVASTEDEAQSGKPSMVTTKTSLSTSLSLAKTTQNAQITALVLNVLTQIFFTGISGEQAEKSARAARATASNWRSPLWTAVADGMLEQTLGLLGKESEKKAVTADGMEKLAQLPEGIRKRLDYSGP
ncbi:MAG: hypothetical protein M1821_003225 [Bathelium mastoideum]|nr:MAG: hypothetical protein M1821_003225 [Bathelium mastoideum]